MSDRYELFKVEPCPCDGSGYERVLGRDNEEIVIDCSLCAGDGSRRVPTGRMVKHARNHKYPQEGAYLSGTFVGWVDDEADEDGRVADGFYKPLFVEVTDDAE